MVKFERTLLLKMMKEVSLTSEMHGSDWHHVLAVHVLVQGLLDQVLRLVPR